MTDITSKVTQGIIICGGTFLGLTSASIIAASCCSVPYTVTIKRFVTCGVGGYASIKVITALPSIVRETPKLCNYIYGRVNEKNFRGNFLDVELGRMELELKIRKQNKKRGIPVRTI